MPPPNRWAVRQRRHRGVVAPAEPVDQVGEHRTRLDRGELVGVADQHQPGVGAHRLEQPGHHRQRHHRGLVDHDHVVRAAGCRGRAGTGCCCRAASRAAGAGSRPGARPSRARSAGGQRARSRRRTASWSRAAPCRSGRSARSAAAAPPLELGLLGEQRQQTGDRGGLAGAGAAGEHGRPALGGGAARRRAARRSRRPGRRAAAPASSAAASTSGARPGEPGEQVVADLAPPRASSGRGRAGRCSTRSTPLRRPAGWRATAACQAAGVGPGQRRVVRERRSATVARSTQTEPWRTARTASATASSTCSSCSPASAPSRAATWTSAAVEHPGHVERREQAGRRRSASRRSCASLDRLEAARSSCGHHPVQQVGERDRPAPPAAATRRPRTAGRRPPGSRDRTCRAGRGRARRRGGAAGS